jgi:hypothetical protein
MEIPPDNGPSRAGLSPEAIDEALRQILAEGRLVLLPMKRDTASMVPTLHPGQRVAVERAGETRKRGELLLFRGGGERVVHRYLGPASTERGAPCLRTRGDANPMLDAPLDPEDVLGRVVACERDGVWWDFGGAAGELYGLGAALHDLFWAVAAHAAGKLDSLIRRPGGVVRPWIVAWDRRLLGLAHRVFLQFARRREVPRDGLPAKAPATMPGEKARR